MCRVHFWLTEKILMFKLIRQYPKLSVLFLFLPIFQLLLFCEGTRFTEDKRVASMEIARKKGLPELKHHLLPRTRGFVLSCQGLDGAGKGNKRWKEGRREGGRDEEREGGMKRWRE